MTQKAERRQTGQLGAILSGSYGTAIMFPCVRIATKIGHRHAGEPRGHLETEIGRGQRGDRGGVLQDPGVAIMKPFGANLGGEGIGMSDLILQQLEREWIAGRPVPELRPGDVVRVHLRVREGDKERVQVFQGTVIRIRGSGTGRTFTVRRIAAHGIGVERTFPLYSPRIDHIEVVRHSRVRRARLYYLRERFGKAARLKERLMAAPEAAELPSEAPEASEEVGA